MSYRVYEFSFVEAVDLDQAEAVLHRAIEAAEGLFGEALVRIEAGYRRDNRRRSLFVDGSTEASQAITRIFTSFVIKEFGSTAFTLSKSLGGQPTAPLAIAT